jgi:signal transduction histidine kinase
LHNVVKHAEASHLTLSLGVSPPASAQREGDWQGEISLCVSDDGQGFEPGQGGADQLGLAIMRERAMAVGARLSIDSQPGQGARVTLVWESAR